MVTVLAFPPRNDNLIVGNATYKIDCYSQVIDLAAPPEGKLLLVAADYHKPLYIVV